MLLQRQHAACVAAAGATSAAGTAATALIRMQKTSLAAFLELLIESTRSVAIAAALATKKATTTMDSNNHCGGGLNVCLFVVSTATVAASVAA